MRTVWFRWWHRYLSLSACADRICADLKLSAIALVGLAGTGRASAEPVFVRGGFLFETVELEVLVLDVCASWVIGTLLPGGGANNLSFYLYARSFGDG